eukprot:TRINITY_DN11829_c0_g1_i2.p1 TRINITY_DN11829_c0_g1~~TRINITY_DN11829_c0_g1_i2.p1  ORF type:complete len:110 (-),score=7.66 TRINITY_DN11829_c0_g1_i2:217-546(-)
MACAEDSIRPLSPALTVDDWAVSGGCAQATYEALSASRNKLNSNVPVGCLSSEVCTHRFVCIVLVIFRAITLAHQSLPGPYTNHDEDNHRGNRCENDDINRSHGDQGVL